MRHLSDIDFYRSPVVSDMKVAQKNLFLLFLNKEKKIYYIYEQKKKLLENNNTKNK